MSDVPSEAALVAAISSPSPCEVPLLDKDVITSCQASRRKQERIRQAGWVTPYSITPDGQPCNSPFGHEIVSKTATEVEVTTRVRERIVMPSTIQTLRRSLSTVSGHFGMRGMGQDLTCGREHVGWNCLDVHF